MSLNHLQIFAASEGSYGHRERPKLNKLFFDFCFPSVFSVSSVAKRFSGLSYVNRMRIWAVQIRNAELLWWLNIRRRIGTGWVALVMVLAFFSGCAVTDKGAFVSRLEDGRQGFVIREKTDMDAASRGEFERAVAMMNNGKNDTAIELLARVIGRSPGVTAPYINIAMAYTRTGKPEPAEQHLKTALGLVPNHPVASNEYALLLRKGGRFKEAREIYEKAIAGFPDYLPARRNLGILCDLYLNDPACALKQFEIYSEKMPEDAQVKIWIDELRMRPGR